MKPKQNGRPKKPRFVAVRLTDREFQALDRVQAVKGLKTRSDAIREAIVTRDRDLEKGRS